jgi:N6-adenosine-specific RNA methylase IME4
MADLPAGPYSVILADPPWAFRTYTSEGRTPTQKQFRHCEDHYSTMSFAEMAALPVADIADRNAVLAMWVVGSHLDEALRLGEAWGFQFCTDLLCWMKQKMLHAQQPDLFTGDIPEPRISMGYYTRKQKEDCWLFKRGKGLSVLAHDVRQVIVEPSEGHSRKPAEQYHRIERLFGDVPRIELFARNTAPGWDSWGNEVGKFDPARAMGDAA